MNTIEESNVRFNGLIAEIGAVETANKTSTLDAIHEAYIVRINKMMDVKKSVFNFFEKNLDFIMRTARVDKKVEYTSNTYYDLGGNPSVYDYDKQYDVILTIDTQTRKLTAVEIKHINNPTLRAKLGCSGFEYAELDFANDENIRQYVKNITLENLDLYVKRAEKSENYWYKIVPSVVESFLTNIRDYQLTRNANIAKVIGTDNVKRTIHKVTIEIEEITL